MADEDGAGDHGSQPIPSKHRSKKTRSISTGQNLQKIWIANGKKKLPIEFDIVGKSWLPVGPNQKLYTRAIGNKIKEVVIPCYKDWASVPEEKQKKVFKRVKKYFDIRGTLTPRQYKKVLKSFDRSAAERFRGYKAATHRYYKKQLEKSSSTPRPYRNFTNEEWQQCINLFSKPEFIERSIKNSENRSKHKYPCFQGSKSLVAHSMDWECDEEEESDPSFIALFREMHTDKESGEWVNKAAESDYSRLLEARESAQLAFPDDIVDERAIMREVFGTRRGHECGFGRILKGSKSSAIHDIPESSITSNSTRKDTQGATPNAESYVNLLKEFEKMSKTLARLKAKVGIDIDEEEETDAQFTHQEHENMHC